MTETDTSSPAQDFMTCKSPNCARRGRSMFKGHCCWQCAMRTKRNEGGDSWEEEIHGPWCICSGEWIPAPGPTNHELNAKMKLLNKEVENLKYQMRILSFASSAMTFLGLLLWKKHNSN